MNRMHVCSTCGMILTWKTEVLRAKPDPASQCPPQTPYGINTEPPG